MNSKVILKVSVIYLILILMLTLTMSLSQASEEQELKSELLKLTNVKGEMINAGIGVARVDDLITEGFFHFNNNNFDKTKEIINSVHELRDVAFEAKKELSTVKQIHLDIKERNISLINITTTKIEWELEYAQREFDKENFEGALETLERTKKTLIPSINNEYGYLSEAILLIEEKIGLLGLGNSIVASLKDLLSESLETGKLEKLDIIKDEIADLNKSITYYDEISRTSIILEEKNLTVKRIEDGLKVSELDLSFGDYGDALSKLESLHKSVNNAIILEEDIRELENTVKEEKTRLKNNFTEAETFLNKAKQELFLGNYEGAEQHLGSAKSAFEDIKAGILVGRVGSKSFGINLVTFIRNYWAYILLVIVIILVILKFTQSSWVYWLRKKRIAKLERESKINEEMIKKLQKDYFVHKKMARESYEESYDALQDKILKAKDRLSQLNKKVYKKG